MYRILIRLFTIFLLIFQSLFKSKENLVLENIALRQQLSTYQTKRRKPRLTNIDRSFWIALKLVFSRWMDFLIIVKPETVIDWQNRRFKRHWTNISSCKKPGRKRIKKEIRELIYRMAREKPLGSSENLFRIADVGF